MKRIHLMALTAVFVLLGHDVLAQEKPAFITDRYVTVEDGLYWLNSESYVTGEYVEVESEERLPADIILLLDTSSSMNADFSSSFKYWKPFDESYSGYDLENGSYYYHWSDGKYYKVTMFYPPKVGLYLARCWAFFDVGTERYYLTGTSVVQAQDQTNPTFNGDSGEKPKDIDGNVIEPIVDRNSTLWKGILYKEANVSDKISALKASISTFIDEVHNDAVNYGVNHRISLIQYSSDDYPGTDSDYINPSNSNFLAESSQSGYTSVVMKPIEVSSLSTVDALKLALQKLSPSGDTASDYGFALADLVAGHYFRDDELVSKSAIMFTDGVPNHGGNPIDVDVANKTVSISKELKKCGLTVFTTGLFSSTGTDIINYMNAVSSNYPYANSIDDMGIGKDDGFFIDASKADLKDIFTLIARKTIISKAKVKLGINAVAANALSPDFRIPSGYDANRIVTKVRDYMASTGEWGAQKDPSPAVTKHILAGPEGTITVNVSGYDYSSHWVGKDATSGQKLIVKVPVEPVPGLVGGKNVPVTDGDGSGMYMNDELVLDFDDPVTADVPVNIVISKSGLTRGCSAIFVVYVNTNGSYPSASGSKPKWEEFTRVILTGVNDDGRAVSASLKGLAPEVYKIEETAWSWTYEDATGPQTTIDHRLNPIPFVNVKGVSAYKNAEAAVSNNLKSK